MTALPVATNVIRFRFIQSQGGSTNIQNRVYFLYSGTAPNVTEMQTLSGQAHTAFTNFLLPQLSSVLVLHECQAVDLSKDTNPEVSTSLNKAGALGPGVLPPGNCAMIDYQIDRRYRGGHPRWYQSGVLEGNVDDTGTLLQPWAGNYKNAHDQFLNDIGALRWTGATNFQHCNVSYYSGFTNVLVPGKRAKVESTPRSSPTTDVIVGTSIRAEIASQRRRNIAL